MSIATFMTIRQTVQTLIVGDKVTVSVQRISTISYTNCQPFIVSEKRLLRYHKSFIILPLSIASFRTAKTQFKVALRGRFNTQIFRPERDEIRGMCRRLQKDELHDLYNSKNILWVIKQARMKWVEPVACTGGQKRCIYDFGGETWGKRPLGRPMCRWEDNIKTDPQEMGWTDMDWIYLAQNRDR